MADEQWHGDTGLGFRKIVNDRLEIVARTLKITDSAGTVIVTDSNGGVHIVQGEGAFVEAGRLQHGRHEVEILHAPAGAVVKTPGEADTELQSGRYFLLAREGVSNAS